MPKLNNKIHSIKTIDTFQQTGIRYISQLKSYNDIQIKDKESIRRINDNLDLYKGCKKLISRRS